MYDSRYFSFISEVGRCACGIVRDTVTEIIVQRYPDFMEGEGWEEAIKACGEENRVLKGFLTEGKTFSHIRTHGMKFVHKDLEAMRQSAFFDIPNWSELRKDGKTWRRLFVPTKSNYEAIDAVIALMEKKKDRKLASASNEGYEEKGKGGAKNGGGTSAAKEGRDGVAKKGRGGATKRGRGGATKRGRGRATKRGRGGVTRAGRRTGKIENVEDEVELENEGEDKNVDEEQSQERIKFTIFLIQITLADTHSDSETLFFKNLWKKYYDSICAYLALISDAKDPGDESRLTISITFVWFHEKEETVTDFEKKIPDGFHYGDITTYLLWKIPLRRVLPDRDSS